MNWTMNLFPMNPWKAAFGKWNNAWNAKLACAFWLEPKNGVAVSLPNSGGEAGSLARLEGVHCTEDISGLA